MDLGGVLGVSAIIVAIFLSTGIFVWQSNSQAGRFDTRMDRLEDRMGRFEDRMAEFEDRIDEKIEIVGRRVTDSELEQARLNGVNSVLAGQTHTHETVGN